MELDKVEQSGTKQLVAAAIAIIAPQARRKPLERCALDEPADIRVGATPIRRLIDGPAEAHRKWQAPHLADATAARFMAVFVGAVPRERLLSSFIRRTSCPQASDTTQMKSSIIVV